MRIAVLGSTESWYVKDLRRAAATQHDVQPVTFRGLSSHVSNDGVAVNSDGLDLQDFDAIFIRTMPAGSLEQVVLRMDALAQLQIAGKLVVNPPKAIEAAVDKYLATARLQAAGLSVPPTIACQTVDDAMAAFGTLGGDVVTKPLFGAEGRGIARLTDESVAWRTFKLYEQLQTVIYLQPFIEHEGYDLRLFVLGDEVYGMKRSSPCDWRTNVSRGATTEPLEVTPELNDIAQRSAAAVGAVVAGVDVLIGRDGSKYVLEVNAVPGWQALARTLQIDIAERMISFLCQ